MTKTLKRLLFLMFTIRCDNRKIATDNSAQGNAFANRPAIFIDASIKNSGDKYNAKFTQCV